MVYFDETESIRCHSTVNTARKGVAMVPISLKSEIEVECCLQAVGGVLYEHEQVG
jgi:hypothetical protein